MFLAEAAAGATSNFNTFDIFMIAFTLLIFIGLVRLLAEPFKNKFAIGFTTVSLVVFLYSDYAMILGWLS